MFAARHLEFVAYRPILTAALVLFTASFLIAMPGIAIADQMVFPGGDWERASPESQSVDSDRLQTAVDFVHALEPGRINDLAIIRNGRMISETNSITNRRHVASVTKSFTSTVLGLLIDDGRVTLDTLAATYVPDLAEKYPDVTLEHFATTTSGYRAAGEEGRWLWSNTPFTPEDPFFAPPGSQFFYSQPAIEQLSNALTQIAGEPIRELFWRRVAVPIGMSQLVWPNWLDDVDPSPNPPDSPKINSGSTAMEITAEDAARFGHLFLNRGQWNGEQLISAEWVDAATRVQVPASLPRHPESTDESGGPGIYGYNWWVNGLHPDGKRLYPGAPFRTYAAHGASGSRIFVIPEWNMVIARQAEGEFNWMSNVDWSNFIGKIGLAIGDLNDNGVLDVSDIDAVSQAVATGSTETRFDMNADGNVDVADVNTWVKDLKYTWIGDANLDGEFNSGDLVAVFTAGEYQDATENNSTWGTGDWNADGDFTSGDLVAAFIDGGYGLGPSAGVNAVPEPTTLSMLIIALIGGAIRRRHALSHKVVARVPSSRGDTVGTLFDI